MPIYSLAYFARAQVRFASNTSLDGVARQYLRPTVFARPSWSISSDMRRSAEARPFNSH
jgi:hypothetical protein